jgi:hypothetical protein
MFAPLKPYPEWLERAKLIRMFSLDEAPNGGGRVLMRTTDEKPLIVSRTVGAGEVVFFATALDETWGRMMSEGHLAVPMTTYLIAHLTARQIPGGTRTVGDTLTWTPPKQESGFELIKPHSGGERGERTRPRVKLGEAKSVDGQLVVSSSDTSVAGAYALVPIGAPDPVDVTGAAGVWFVLNPDLHETENLDVLSDLETENLLGFHPTIIQAGAGTAMAVRDRRTRGEWTELVLLAVLLVLVGEGVWAWYCGAAR